MTEWITTRTLAAQAADPAGAPAVSLGVALGQTTPIVEFRLRDLVLAGGPTAVTFHFWRIEGTVAEFLGSRTILAADVGVQKPARFVSESSKCFVTVSFTGGGGPTVDGLIEARGLYNVAETDDDNPEGLATDAARESKQDVGNASLANIEIDTADISSHASQVASAFFPSWGATAASGVVQIAGLQPDGTNSAVPTLYDLDTGAGREFCFGMSLRRGAATTSEAMVGSTTMAKALPVTIATDDTVMADIAAHASSVDGKMTACNTNAVTIASSALPAHAATSENQTTLGSQTTKINDGANTAAVKAASTAPAATDPALVVALSPNSVALKTGVRNSTAPAWGDANEGRIQLAPDGSSRINADCYDWLHQYHLVASTAAQQVACVRTPPSKAFDGLWVQTDGVVVYGQPRGRPYLVADGLTLTDPTKWTTAGTDWTAGGAGTLVHAAGGAGTDTLVGTMGSPLIVGKTYLVYCKGTKAAGTSATVYCGTAAGTAIAANAPFEFVQALVCTGTSSCQIVATDDCDITFTAYQIYEATPRLSAYSYMPFAMTEILGVASGAALTTLIVATGCDVHGIYRRKPGVLDLG